ncbi:outer membrane protein assembly factor BamE domain-containing protein [Variovorax sp. VNK109]|uniref:outer membrane protein assembly factor BamE domain-containing protein n=1 Tax=Variovorax sp. VNK109 TaxID=3400919 RepID=UPI003C009B13
MDKSHGRGRWTGWLLAAMLATGLLVLAGCDPQRISELEEGVSTEADVRARFGDPQQVWEGPAGARVFEYSQQPAGHRNYMITIGTDGKMSALRQVLTPENFAKVRPGMKLEEVRRVLGKPMKVTPYPLKNETHFDWRYLDGPNMADSKIFTVVFDKDLYVARTGSIIDPEVQPK